MAPDIHSLITSVVDLAPVAREGFTVHKEILAADKTMAVQFGRLEIQQKMYDEWRGYWRDESRLRSFAKEHPSMVRRMLKQIAILTQALTDATGLEHRFSFAKTERPRQIEEDVSSFRFDDLSPSIVDTFRARAKANLSFIQKCRYVLRSKRDLPQLNALLEIIKDCNVALRDLSPPLDSGMLMRSEIDPLKTLPHPHLKRLAEAAACEAKLTDEPSEATRYHDLSLAAQFTAVLKYETAKPVFRFGPQDVHIDASYELGKYETMALLFDYPLKGEKRVVLIEWVKDGGRPERRKEVYDLALVLAASKPGAMLIASCYGVIEDPKYGRVGLVLAPPPHIRSGLPKMLPPGTVSAFRMPVSLRDLITRKQASTGSGDIMDLSLRFTIAQRLLDAVHVMHSTTWVHKNIRPDSIIFFPSRERSKSGAMGPSLSKPQAYALDAPLLVGFNHIRSSLPQELMNSNIGYNNRQYSVSVVKRDMSFDAYSHPERFLNPGMEYRNYHDLYSVGCVLLEIGYWDTIDRLLSIHSGLSDPVAVYDHLRVFAEGIDGMMGLTYGNVVRKLLDLGGIRRDFDSAGMETRLAATLSQCSA
ncbi:hypothetical protein MKZ38_004955 [Zalerion maritima]|uniref:Protein kinase domain-containing protein n=1 Tax=Zalerion maritima TaxID=339359 RepID=A0AAD5RKV9_9PEZI|nr:hypothetical protein MKZ38_004955 [Zalerion maritima]